MASQYLQTPWAVATVLESATGVIGLGFLGVLSHRLYFIHGEHDLKAPLYLMVWLFTSILIASVVYVGKGSYYNETQTQAIYDALEILTISNFSFLFPLTLSIISYRLFEHPLKSFKGPRLAAVSKLWHLRRIFSVSNHLFLDNLHQKYGNIVRTGPQELTVIDPDVFDAISGPKGGCIKSSWYDILYPYIALNSIRTKHGYAPRRRRWDEALGLSASYIPNKELRLKHYSMLLLRQIQATKSSPLNLTTSFHHFAFDVMGEIAFEHSFSLMDDSASESDQVHIPALVSQGISMLQFFTPVPWTSQLCFSIAPYAPIISQKWNKAMGWAAMMVDTRLARESISKDIGEADEKSQFDAFSRFILSAREDQDDKSLDRLSLYGDALAIIVAGSHTTAGTLTMMFYELARQPNLQAELRDEILASNAMMPNESESYSFSETEAGDVLEKLPLLNACINETLRLYPQVPTGGIRQTTEKGIMIGDTWIPPQTIIVAPRWSIGRLESAFVKPTKFIPERWTTKPEMIKEARAFNAFGGGRHSCPGKQFGLMEVRMATAIIVSNFEFSISSPKEKKNQVLDDFVDAFTAFPGKLELAFKPIRA